MSALLEAMRGTVTQMCEARDTCLDGSVIDSWLFSAPQGIWRPRLPSVNGPWERQARVNGGDWEILGGRREDGSYWRTALGRELSV